MEKYKCLRLETPPCGPVNLTLDAGNATNPLVNYKWMPGGQTTRNININLPGAYGVSVFIVDDFHTNAQIVWLATAKQNKLQLHEARKQQ